jgi:tetratricopeptide (TPR) repeat protein
MAKFRSTNAAEMRAYLERADAAFRRALELNPELPIAHNLYTALECDLSRATDAMIRLLGQVRVRPADAELFAGLVHACRYGGLLDASLAADRRARQLDPHVATSVAHTHWMRGDYARAVDDPLGASGYVCALALASMGREEEAIAMLREREQRADQWLRGYLFALRALLEGDRRASLAALEEGAPTNPDPESLYYVARSFARLGDADAALATLERVTEGFFCHPVLLRDPWLDPLRGRPRFIELLQAAEARHREAATRFVEAGGPHVLGLSS